MKPMVLLLWAVNGTARVLVEGTLRSNARGAFIGFSYGQLYGV